MSKLLLTEFRSKQPPNFPIPKFQRIKFVGVKTAQPSTEMHQSQYGQVQKLSFVISIANKSDLKFSRGSPDCASTLLATGSKPYWIETNFSKTTIERFQGQRLSVMAKLAQELKIDDVHQWP